MHCFAHRHTFRPINVVAAAWTPQHCARRGDDSIVVVAAQRRFVMAAAAQLLTASTDVSNVNAPSAARSRHAEKAHRPPALGDTAAPELSTPSAGRVPLSFLGTRALLLGLGLPVEQAAELC